MIVTWPSGGAELAFEALGEGAADAEEGLGEGVGAEAGGFGKGVDGGSGLVAGEDEFALLFREAAEAFAEADFDGAGLGGGGGFAGELVEDVVVEDVAVAGLVAAMGFHLEEGDAAGPGHEGEGGVEFGGFSPDDEVGFLEDVFGGGAVGDEGEDVVEQRRLVAGQLIDQRFVGVFRVFGHGVREVTANRADLTRKNGGMGKMGDFFGVEEGGLPGWGFRDRVVPGLVRGC